MRVSKPQLEQAHQLLALGQLLARRRYERPDEWYEPSCPGLIKHDGTVCGEFANQLGFHQAHHKIRVMVPGNGWGKTTAMGAECHNWAMHTNRWQRTPEHTVAMMWFVNLATQFELVRAQLEDEIFGSTANWHSGHPSYYSWPDGSRLYMGSASDQNQWKKWQGIPIDLCCFDEMPPRQLWREMLMRHRGKRKTKYVIGATATDGAGSWAEGEIYKPWLEYHQMLGLDEVRAMAVQDHPDIWCWPIGGIQDNPAADAEDKKHYESVIWSSEKKRKVRLRGGFEQWVGDPVFAEEAIAWLEETAFLMDKGFEPGRVGFLEVA